ncbi:MULTISPECIES: IS110 family RNA-guided transposase [Mycolicibacterium]|uniref:Transposase IS116/IS110/IS902 family protein n=2 Tax=Mycolicibacterium TaxID=1866885 RepID=A1TDV6_MYCVP|nr:MULTISPECIES: IS110 family transposase [Mycolicibacterium]ABM15356.1 transposase IS116/IS110/IS902 family protein [Mycolicibacterium vanbaalenii PYR-1]MCV7129392.1 IS110 family transposase [Mycolicibacterium vanbaalenii PYR-1]MDN4516716.1 IS110 family transposase [Mycolicibacterium austroafricanum]PQP42298.1 IS110 family transposase [Mycolicibacterium austroafricanum]QRZ07246.1 IS110 family transposase [Mycolicibacterium austroafricanum]
MSVQCAPVTSSTIVVAVDVGKTAALFSVTDAARHLLVSPTEFTMNRSGLGGAAASVMAAVPVSGQVKVAVEAAGHYHRPVLDHLWPDGWEVLELNPAHVAEQRRVQGRRRVKTDVIDLEAITELALSGHGRAIADRDVVIGELSAWAGHRSRRITTRTATKNQLLGQLDRAFPGLTLALPDVLGTKIGRLVAAEFSDPSRLAALGVNRLIRFAAVRDLQLRRPVAERLVAAARDALPTRDAAIARQILAADLNLLAGLDAQIQVAEAALAVLLPRSPFSTLTTVPGWGVVRAANYAAALGDPYRWPGPRQIYRASGLSPMQYESAHKRRDGGISREGSVALRRALIDLGLGLWLTEPAAKAYAGGLKARGKRGGVIACALAHRATRIAHALVRDHAAYDPARWI